MRPLFNSNNFAISAVLAEVCALLSAVLVYVLVVLGPRRPDGQHKRYKDCLKTIWHIAIRLGKGRLTERVYGSHAA